MFRFLLLAVVLLAVAARAQVTLVSPEEGRRAVQKAPPAGKPAAAAPAAPAAVPKPGRATILPDSFAGWSGEPPQTIGQYSAGSLSREDASVIAEYGFAGAERRRFTRNGQALQVDAIRMKDTSGSYGLYTFYRSEDWNTRDDGHIQIATRGPETLVRKGDVLVRAAGASLSGAEVDQLAAEISASGSAPLPSVPQFLPAEGIVKATRKYVLGPEGFARVAGPFPRALVDFNLGAEVAFARYNSTAGGAAMMLVSYPTPQAAAAKLKTFEQTPVAGDSVSSTLYGRRRGSLLAFVAGAPNRGVADSLLDRLRYAAEITWNEAAPKKQPSVSGFLLALFKFTGLLLLFAIAGGICFALLRLVAQVWFPHQIFDRPEETEFIRLNINYGR